MYYLNAVGNAHEFAAYPLNVRGKCKMATGHGRSCHYMTGLLKAHLCFPVCASVPPGGPDTPERGLMPRPREFDEPIVLEAAMRCFWHRGYEQTSMRDLAEEMGITSASITTPLGTNGRCIGGRSTTISKIASATVSRA